MAYSKTTYTGSGIAGPYSVPFPYLAKSHVLVYINGVLTTAYTWASASTILFNSVVAVDAIITLRRSSSPNARLVDHQDASVLTEATLDADALQQFYLYQEAQDDASAALQRDLVNLQWDAGGFTIINVADPVDPQDAVTKAYGDANYADLAEARRCPQRVLSVDGTLTLADAGRHILSNNAGAQTITLPLDAVVSYGDAGAIITIVNRGTTAITIDDGGSTMQLAGGISTGNRTLAVGGVATLLNVGADDWFISGAGIT